jgi:hypothetical protein
MRVAWCRERFWSHTPNFLLSEAHAVVPSPQMSGRRVRNVALTTSPIAWRSGSANVAAEYVAQIGDAFPMVAVGYAFEAGIGSESVSAAMGWP